MRKVNVLCLITKLELGGAQKQLLDLLAEIDKSRFNVLLFTAAEGLLMTEACALPGIRVERSRFLERSLDPIRDILAIFEIYSFIKKSNIDVVHTHSSKAGVVGRLAAAMAGCKVIVHTVHGWSFYAAGHGFVRSLCVALERFCARLSRRLIVVSEFDRQEGLRNSVGKQTQYVLLPYGVRTADFTFSPQSREGVRRAWGVGPDELLVGMVSCLKPQKSPQDFVRLAYALRDVCPQVKFVLVGDGILRPQIETLREQCALEDRVILAGWRRDIPAVLSALDVLVLTSRWEGLPVSILEAAMCERPVLATDTGGLRDLIEDGKTGLLAEVGADAEMALKLKALLGDPGLRQTLAAAAKAAARPQYELGRMVQETEALYLSLL